MDGSQVIENDGVPYLRVTGSPEQREKFFAELATATAEFDEIEKDRKGQYGGQYFKYATLGGLIAATRPSLAKHGIVCMQFVHPVPGEPLRKTLVTQLVGHGVTLSTSDDFPLPAETRDPNSTRSFEWIKEVGKVRTYQRRYAYQTLLMLDAEPDADEAGMPGQRPEEPRREAPRPQEQPRQQKPAPRRQEPAAAKPEPKPEAKAEPSKPLSFDKPMEREPAEPVPPADPMAEKLSTPVPEAAPPEPTVEPEDGPPDSSTMEELFALQRKLGMGKMELAQICERDWGFPVSAVRASRRAALLVRDRMAALAAERAAS